MLGDEMLLLRKDLKAPKIRTPDSPDYKMIEGIIQQRIASNIEPLFVTVPSVNLFDLYLQSLPNDRQHYNCRTCRRFVEVYGPLVTIDADGVLKTLLWTPQGVPAFFFHAFHNLQNTVAQSRIDTVFVNDSNQWGVPETKGWTHLAGCTTKVYKNPLTSAAQKMAVFKEEHGMLTRALANYQLKTIRTAITLLESGTFNRAEHALPIAKWFSEVYTATLHMRWRMVALAPPGYCHINATMIGSLLDDIQSHKTTTQIQAAWDRKMGPLAYRRPTAPLTTQQINRAEEVIGKMASEGSLRRRTASLSDITAYIWQTAPIEKPPILGIFSDLRKDVKPTLRDMPKVTMTWVKFYKNVLPYVRKLSYCTAMSGQYYGLVAPCNPDAPKIIQWDNQVTWYVYVGGSSPRDWGLTANQWVDVKMIFNNPAHWSDPNAFQHQGNHVFFALDGAHDRRYVEGGLFFLSHLRSEYKPIEKVLEQHSKNNRLDKVGPNDANGMMFAADQPWNAQFRVVTNETVQIIDIDRFD